MCSEPMFEAKMEAPMIHQLKVAAGQEVIAGGVLASADDPPGHAQQDAEVERDGQPVNSGQGCAANGQQRS